MIVEGLLTTVKDDGSPHVAPMGPVVNQSLTQWTLRPFQTSTTFQALRHYPFGIFHVVDDVLPVARAALGIEHAFAFEPHETGGFILPDACRWFRLEVIDWNTDDPRSEARARVHSSATLRDFWGWNRAKHAVLEAAIIGTRKHLIPAVELARGIEQLRSPVEKTGGARELQAWAEICEHLELPALAIKAGT
ncbi:MAG TPA: DUF447 domain-containing protein [Planctomycetaceae bacterium]|nr:DUF447 domain-containing protein [Planctomycetaceae bacterium]